MSIELLCRKLGMTQIYDDNGNSLPVTVLEAGPNVVVQKKTLEGEGYSALQLGFGDRRPDLFTKPQRGHFEKANVAPLRHLVESRVTDEEAGQYEVGAEVKCDLFEVGQTIDVVGTSKGRGHQGVVKRHNFAIKRRTHGTHEFFRHGGAIGAGAYPGKVTKGMKMSGQMGNERVTLRNTKILRIDADKNLIFVHGGVPGYRNGIVRVRAAVAPR